MSPWLPTPRPPKASLLRTVRLQASLAERTAVQRCGISATSRKWCHPTGRHRRRCFAGSGIPASRDPQRQEKRRRRPSQRPPPPQLALKRLAASPPPPLRVSPRGWEGKLARISLGLPSLPPTRASQTAAGKPRQGRSGSASPPLSRRAAKRGPPQQRHGVRRGSPRDERADGRERRRRRQQHASRGRREVKYDLNNPAKHAKLDFLNNLATGLVFVIVVVNIFITAFGVQKPSTSKA
ncbi:ninjurin-1 isoform X1 [Paroedura picta]|uniref:ninjurin-1 isoform X1 n=1 Tax=Paroedura picta TaxID=143630 RepID=UPI0040567765